MPSVRLQDPRAPPNPSIALAFSFIAMHHQPPRLDHALERPRTQRHDQGLRATNQPSNMLLPSTHSHALPSRRLDHALERPCTERHDRGPRATNQPSNMLLPSTHTAMHHHPTTTSSLPLLALVSQFERPTCTTIFPEPFSPTSSALVFAMHHQSL